MKTLLALLLLSLSLTTASADWPRDAFTCRAYRADLYWHEWAREHCRDYRWRYRQRSRQAYRQHTYAHEDGCRRVIESTGEQAQSKDNAEALALRNWQGRVRFHYGEKFIQFENARDRKITCSASSVADTVGGKIQEKLMGVSHFRCELSARPCAAPARNISRGDD